mgnify:CR=1 FL=1
MPGSEPPAGVAAARLAKRSGPRSAAAYPARSGTERRRRGPTAARLNDILAAFVEVPRAALLGEPGSGKSTTLRKLGLELAVRARKDAAAPLPLLVPLGSWTGDASLGEFLESVAPEIGWAVARLAGNERLVLLLDGLNEVPTLKRDAKAGGVCGLRDSLPPEAPIVVSCRPEDYTGALDLGFDTLTLEPLSPQRIRAAVHQWVADAGEPGETAERFFWQLAGDDELAAILNDWRSRGISEDEFWNPKLEWYLESILWEGLGLWQRHIPDRRSLIRLAANPFMLTMLFQVWVADEGLPRNRGDPETPPDGRIQGSSGSDPSCLAGFGRP